MANGHFFGGLAEGIESGRSAQRARDALGLQERGLGLQERQLEQTGAFENKRIGIAERTLGLQERTAANVERRAGIAEVDTQITNTMALAAKTIEEARKADRDPETIRKAVTPLLKSAQSLAQRIGRDPRALAGQLDAQIMGPGAVEAATAEGKAVAAKNKAAIEGGASLLKPEQRVTVENSLRDDFVKQSEPFIETRDAYSRIQSIKDDGKTGVGDVALVYSYMKMLDPRSTVREGEIAMARDASGVPGQVVNLYNSLVNGATLTPDVRRGFRSHAKELFGKQAQQHQIRVKTFGEIAKRQGADPQNVVIDLSPPEEAQPTGGGMQIPEPPKGFKVIP